MRPRHLQNGPERDYPPRLNGKRPHAAPMAGYTRGAMNSTKRGSTAPKTRLKSLHPLQNIRKVRAFTDVLTWQEMCGNGRPIGTIANITAMHRIKTRKGITWLREILILEDRKR